MKDIRDDIFRKIRNKSVTAALLADDSGIIVVGRDQADLLNLDSTNPDFMNHAVISDTLETARVPCH